MNNPKQSTKIFDLNAATLVLLVWGISILTSTSHYNYLPFIVAVIVMMIEKDNRYITNHMGQIVALNLVILIGNIVISVISTILFRLFLWVPIIRLGTGGVINLTLLIYFIVKLVFHLYGFKRAMDRETCDLPFIGDFGNWIETLLLKTMAN